LLHQRFHDVLNVETLPILKGSGCHDAKGDKGHERYREAPGEGQYPKVFETVAFPSIGVQAAAIIIIIIAVAVATLSVIVVVPKEGPGGRIVVGGNELRPKLSHPLIPSGTDDSTAIHDNIIVNGFGTLLGSIATAGGCLAVLVVVGGGGGGRKIGGSSRSNSRW